LTKQRYVAPLSDGCSQTHYTNRSTFTAVVFSYSPNSHDQQLGVEQRADIRKQSDLEGVEDLRSLILSLIQGLSLILILIQSLSLRVGSYGFEVAGND
jgi:hypothetical protein